MSEAVIKPVYRRRWDRANSKAQLHWIGIFFIVAFAVMTSLVFAFGFYFITSDAMSNQGLGLWRFELVIAMLVFWVVLTLTTWKAFMMTLKVSGPIYHFRKILKDIAQGDYGETEVKLRRGDSFQELADDLNVTLNALRKKDTLGREATETMALNLKKLGEMILEKKEEAKEQDLKNALQELHDACETLTDLYK